MDRRALLRASMGASLGRWYRWPGVAPLEGDLEMAFEAARWIASTQVDTDLGPAWPADAGNPESTGPALYHGASGPTLFATGLLRAASTGDQRDLARTLLGTGSSYLARSVEQDRVSDSGLYTGLAGVALALLEAQAEAPESERIRSAALLACERILERGKKVASGSSWSTSTDIISGDAGTGLFCLTAAGDHRLGDEELEARLLTVAAAVGDHLLSLAEDGTDGARTWKMTPDYPRRMPNFSHGTAGVAYFLGRLAEVTGEDRFLAGALAGARGLQAIADERCLVHHHRPGGEDLYYLGWCHGPAGTGRLFHLLGRLTKDESWSRWSRQGLVSLAETGIPEKRPEGFWNNVGICCGSAGIAEYALEMSRTSKGESGRTLARELTDDLLERGTRDASGLRWAQAEHRTRPEWTQTQTGYMQGAAGIGLLLLRWNDASTLRLPDSPF